mmetsp:Transcript_100699/g.177307  ORF Transcript_100699/g.177307 Transcript_100699/m.177307 type:complete len:130 (-) Transcript_100699:232-621(-)
MIFSGMIGKESPQGGRSICKMNQDELCGHLHSWGTNCYSQQQHSITNTWPNLRATVFSQQVFGRQAQQRRNMTYHINLQLNLLSRCLLEDTSFYGLGIFTNKFHIMSWLLQSRMCYVLHEQALPSVCRP